MNDKRFIIGQVVTVIIAIVGQVITIAIAIVGWHITTNNTKSQIENSVDIEVAQQIINARPYMLTGKGKYKNGSIIASASKHIDFNKISNEDLTYIENNGSNPLNNLTIVVSYVDDETDYLIYHYFKIESLNPNERIYLISGINNERVEYINTQFDTKNNETVQVSYDFKDYNESIPGLLTELNDFPKKKTTYYDNATNIKGLKKLSGDNTQVKDIKSLKGINDLNTQIDHPVDEKHLYFQDYLFNK
ncbi:hypothetical protein [Limosilactobacillus vaginalis]|uniref:hypothetical protein n=1 Tax=Limosilactobacillus vaginalis TaxID=1633 RepID=UPI001F09793A|nr:hypothetical protein [Limosilactobacillus vaginalis]